MIHIFLLFLNILDIGECFSSPCVNAYSCLDLVNDYKCRCKIGWTGKNCHISKLNLYYCLKGLYWIYVNLYHWNF